MLFSYDCPFFLSVLPTSTSLSFSLSLSLCLSVCTAQTAGSCLAKDIHSYCQKCTRSTHKRFKKKINTLFNLYKQTKINKKALCRMITGCKRTFGHFNSRQLSQRLNAAKLNSSPLYGMYYTSTPDCKVIFHSNIKFKGFFLCKTEGVTNDSICRCICNTFLILFPTCYVSFSDNSAVSKNFATN